MKTFLLLINLLILSTFVHAAPEPIIKVTHSCNGTLGAIDYSYEGSKEYQIEWSQKGGERTVTKSGAGTLKNLKPGTYELYLLISGKKQSLRYGPYYYNVLNLTPNFSVLRKNDCNGVVGDASIEIRLKKWYPEYKYLAQLKNSKNQIIRSEVIKENSQTFEKLKGGKYSIEVSTGKACAYKETIVIKDEINCAPKPMIKITHACKKELAFIHYSYEGNKEFQIEWSRKGGESIITKPGAGTLKNLKPGTYELYLLIPEKKQSLRYGPYYYNILDLTPKFSTTEGNSCNGTSGDATLKVNVNPMHSGYVYTTILKNSNNQILRTVTMSSANYTFTGLSSGNYMVKVLAGKKCSSEKAVLIKDETLAFTVSATAKTCHDIGGDLQITLPNFQSNLTYTVTLVNDDPTTLLGPNNNQTITFTQTSSTYTLANIAPGNYTISIDDGNCIGSESITVEEVGVDILATIEKKGICFWNFEANLPAGTTAISYDWFFKNHVGASIPALGINTIGDQTSNILNTSWVKVIVTTDDGCVYEKEMDISSELFLDNQLPDVFPFNTTCGQSNGSISVDWIKGFGMNDLFNINQVVIRQTPSGPPLQTVNVNISGNGGVLYSAYFQGLAAGTYYIDFITDLDCYTSENLPIEVTIVEESIEIEGSVFYNCNENLAYIFIQTPTSGVNYVWKDPSGTIIPGANSSILTTNITATGNYEVIVDDGAGCTASKYFNVSGTNFGEFINIIQPSCGVGGSINLQFTEEVGLPYTITSSSDPSNPITVNSIGYWTGPISFPVNTDGIYSITLTNALGCSVVRSNLVVQDVGLIVRFQNIQKPSHCQSNDGSLDASNVTGGLPPYTYSWSTGASTSTISNLTLSTPYTVTVTDANGCTGTNTYTFNNSEQNVAVYYSWDGPTCSNGNYGTFFTDLSTPPPAAPLIYVWRNDQGQVVGQGPTLSGIPSGNYTLTVKDGNSCTYSRNLFMPSRPAINYIPTLEMLTECKNGFDGFSVDYDALTTCSSLNVEIYEIFDFTGILVDQFVMNQNDPSTHTYNGFDLEYSMLYFRVVITDCCGNVMTAPIQYLNNSTKPNYFIEYPTVTTSTTPASCSILGSINMTITGSNAPYNCIWEDGFVGNNRTDLLAGTYTIQVIGTDGCPKEEVITVPGFNGDAHLINPFPCDGSIDLSSTNITGGQAPYTISWTHNGGSSQTGTTLNLVGDYVLEITDANACVTTEYLTIGNQSFEVTSNVIEPSCAGNDGQIDLTVINNSASIISYNWTGPSNSNYTGHSLDGLIAGTYNYTLVDANGCQQTGSAIVPNNTTLSASLSAGCLPKINYITGGKAPYRIIFTALNTTPLQATYSLDLAATTSYPFDLTELLEGDYSVEVIDDNGCVFNTVINTFSTVVTTRGLPNIQMRWTRSKQVPQTTAPATANTDIVKDDLMQQAQSFLADADKLGSNKDLCKEQGEDALTLDYAMELQHYTLYYYNLRDELIRTVPPEGVEFIKDVDLTNLLDWRSNQNVSAAVPSITIPNHRMVTQYDYNALGQTVRTSSPDKGVAHSFHSSNGLVRFTQDAKQVADKTCSYILYDDLKRTIEVGEIIFSNTLTQAQIEAQIQIQIDDLDALPTGITKDEWVKTYYSIPHKVAGIEVKYYNQNNQEQRYLRNNVSYTENHQGVGSTYSYDIHGNVEWIRQYTPGLGENYVAYDYDLITGNVNEVRYNEFSEDRFFHKYTYDEQNRLKEVYTSTDGIIWDRDAEYEFYAHGSLKRTELGEDRIQGLDYIHTIHGWIKAVNHPFMDQYEADPGITSNDPNNDGFDNSPVMRDVFGYALGYYENDYTRNSFSNPIDFNTVPSLYNGNIAAWSNGINIEAMDASTGASFNSEPEGLTQRNFTYDELNRIKTSKWLQVDGANAPNMLASNNTAYSTSYTYDGNGNIQRLQRNGSTPTLIDDLSYTYGSGDLKNRLEYILDAEGAHTGVGDLDARQEYIYDEIGNLIQSVQKDNAGNITEEINVSWRVDGKVKNVAISNLITGINSEIEFIYDASGNRVAKIYDPNISSPNDQITSYHVRDAAGNIMATYQKRYNGTGFETLLKERTLFGSNRLGINRPENITFGINPINRTNLSVANGLRIRLLKEKVFELSDHLGNVTMTLSDQKQAKMDGYAAQIVSYQQYYPFGWVMPDREFSNVDYLFGFNGKENDEEWGNQNFGARIYDNRITRFLSVDPKTQEYPWETPYSFAANRPITYIDKDGKHPIIVIWLIVEAGLSVYDAYDVVSTLTDEQATGMEKSISAGGLLLGVILPGGGYSAADDVIKYGDEVLDVVKYGDEVLDVGKYGDEILDVGKHGDEILEGRRAANQFLKDAEFPLGTKGWWKNQVKNKTVAENVSNQLGASGEKALKSLYPGGKATKLETKQGGRIIDNLVGNVGHEAKVGYLSPGSSAEKRALGQLSKDIELLQSGKLKEVVWTFFKSPITEKVGGSPKFLEAVSAAQKKGINIKTQISSMKIPLPKVD